MFYGDTAMFGGFLGTKCGLEYFGADHVVFATDMPFGPVRETFEVIDRLELAAVFRDRTSTENAARLMKVTFD